MNQWKRELGIGSLGSCGNDHQDNLENVNNPRIPNNIENDDNQGIHPHVPIILEGPVRDVAVPLTANLTSHIRKLPLRECNFN